MNRLQVLLLAATTFHCISIVSPGPVKYIYNKINDDNIIYFNKNYISINNNNNKNNNSDHQNNNSKNIFSNDANTQKDSKSLNNHQSFNINKDNNTYIPKYNYYRYNNNFKGTVNVKDNNYHYNNDNTPNDKNDSNNSNNINSNNSNNNINPENNNHDNDNASPNKTSDKKQVKRHITRLNTITPNTKPSMLLDRLLQNYIKTDPPSQNATRVDLGVYIISVYSVNEQTMDYSVSMYLRQSWFDPRLTFSMYKMNYDNLRMGSGSWNKIWIPDTFLRNEKGASFHSVTVDNRMMSLNESGVVWYVVKITATLSCLMTLEKFPMDTQVCPMAFESFGYESSTMYFKDMNNMIEKSEDLQLPQFTLVNSSHRDCSQWYTTGSYPCLEVNFILKRDLGYFLIQVYVPSVLIVILSWVSFWINVDASPARVSIGLLTVLTTTTMSSGARATLPRVSYIKAIDVWMIVCLLFVFTSLIEYAVVNVLSRKSTKAARTQNPGTILKRKPPNSCVAVQQAQSRKAASLAKCCKPKAKLAANSPEPDGKKRARAVDKLSRKFFPLTFTVFNFIYWIYYFQQPDKVVGAKKGV